MSQSSNEPMYNPNCPKCGQLRGEWREIWLADVGGSMKMWEPHNCPEEKSEETVATSHDPC